MGDKEREPFQLSFNGFVKVEFRGSRVTSDGGLLLVRELDERLGLGKLIEEHLSDSRQGSNKKFPLADLLRRVGLFAPGRLRGCQRRGARRG